MHLKNVNQGVLLEVKLFPSSKVNKIVKIENHRLYIKVTAAPIENKANEALILILSKSLRVPKTSIQIVKGEKSREKTVLILGKKQHDIDLILNESI